MAAGTGPRHVFAMKTKTRWLALLVALGIEAFFASGCVNTAHGVQQDYHNAEDKAENATR